MSAKKLNEDFAVVKASLKKPELQTNDDVIGVTTGEVDPKMELEQFLGEIAKYKHYGKALRKESLKEIGQRLAKIAEMAEVAVTNEASDWYDAHTLKRHMKEAKGYSSDFLKLAEEADAINQRMSALYEDMGRVLERYFDIPDDLENREDLPVDQYSALAGVTTPTPVSDEAPQKIEEDSIVNGRDPKIYAATELPPVKDDTPKKDELTLRAIVAVHKRLLKKNPEMAQKFKNLPPQMMQKVVWELCDKV